MPATQISHVHHFLLVRATILARISIWVFGGYAIVQGAGILSGGGHRWDGPAYVVLKLAPGGHAFWAFLIIAFGVVTLVGSLTRVWWLKAVGLGGVVAWSFCFAFGTFAAMFGSPIAGTTGGPVYLKDALMAAVLILVDEDRRRR